MATSILINISDNIASVVYVVNDETRTKKFDINKFNNFCSLVQITRDDRDKSCLVIDDEIIPLEIKTKPTIIDEMLYARNKGILTHEDYAQLMKEFRYPISETLHIGEFNPPILMQSDLHNGFDHNAKILPVCAYKILDPPSHLEQLSQMNHLLAIIDKMHHTYFNKDYNMNTQFIYCIEYCVNDKDPKRGMIAHNKDMPHNIMVLCDAIAKFKKIIVSLYENLNGVTINFIGLGVGFLLLFIIMHYSELKPNLVHEHKYQLKDFQVKYLRHIVNMMSRMDPNISMTAIHDLITILEGGLPGKTFADVKAIIYESHEKFVTDMYSVLKFMPIINSVDDYMKMPPLFKFYWYTTLAVCHG